MLEKEKQLVSAVNFVSKLIIKTARKQHTKMSRETARFRQMLTLPPFLSKFCFRFEGF